MLRWLRGAGDRYPGRRGQQNAVYAGGIGHDPVSRCQSTDTEATGVVYSSRPGRVPRGRGSHEVTETRLVGDVHRIKAPQSGVLLPVCSCMFGWRSPRGHEDG